MRIILSNDEAERLLATLGAGLTSPPAFRANKKVRDGANVRRPPIEVSAGRS